MLGIGPGTGDLQKTRTGIDSLSLEVFESDGIEDVNAKGLPMVNNTMRAQKSSSTIPAAECYEWTVIQ